MQYKLLDLFCGAGGAAEGYHKAGFEIVGVDKNPQPNYPYEFIQGDAIDFLKGLRKNHGFNVFHASPPCQKYSKSTRQYQNNGKVYPDLLEPTRLLLSRFTVPTILENVPTAPLRPDLYLYGYMFGLKVERKRIFEINNAFVLQPLGVKRGTVENGDYCTIIGKASWTSSKTAKHPNFKQGTIRETWAYAMGIKHFMTDTEISESIPPAYTHYIGKNIIEYLNKTKAYGRN